MDVQSELARERATLIRADLHIAQGKRRVDRQAALVGEILGRGGNAREAERLLGLLRDTLAQWEGHRTLMLQRIDDLAAKLPSP